MLPSPVQSVNNSSRDGKSFRPNGLRCDLCHRKVPRHCYMSSDFARRRCESGTATQGDCGTAPDQEKLPRRADTTIQAKYATRAHPSEPGAAAART